VQYVSPLNFTLLIITRILQLILFGSAELQGRGPSFEFWKAHSEHYLGYL
jgi:hypothetical protein